MNIHDFKMASIALPSSNLCNKYLNPRLPIETFTRHYNQIRFVPFFLTKDRKTLIPRTVRLDFELYSFESNHNYEDMEDDSAKHQNINPRLPIETFTRDITIRLDLYLFSQKIEKQKNSDTSNCTIGFRIILLRVQLITTTKTWKMIPRNIEIKYDCYVPDKNSIESKTRQSLEHNIPSPCNSLP